MPWTPDNRDSWTCTVLQRWCPVRRSSRWRGVGGPERNGRRACSVSERRKRREAQYEPQKLPKRGESLRIIHLKCLSFTQTLNLHRDVDDRPNKNTRTERGCRKCGVFRLLKTISKSYARPKKPRGKPPQNLQNSPLGPA